MLGEGETEGREAFAQKAAKLGGKRGFQLVVRAVHAGVTEFRETETIAIAFSPVGFILKLAFKIQKCLCQLIISFLSFVPLLTQVLKFI